MDREKVMSVLNLLRPSLSKQFMIPVLSHFCFDDNAVYAFNGVQASVLYMDSDLHCALPGEFLLKLLGSFKSKKLDFLDSEGSVLVKCGSSRPKLVSLSPDNFLFERPDYLTEEDLDVSADIQKIPITEDFVKGLSACLISANDNVALPINLPLGVVYQATSTSAFLFSSNNVCLSQYELSKEFYSEKDVTFCIPTSFCEQVISWYSNFKSGTLVFKEEELQVIFEGGYLFTTLTDYGNPVDFVQMFNNQIGGKDLSFIPVPANFKEIVDRSLMWTSSNSSESIVTVTIEGTFLELFTSDDTSGELRDEVDLDVDCGDLCFKMDVSLLQKSLSNISEMCFLVVGRGSNSIPVVVGKDGNFLHIISSCIGE